VTAQLARHVRVYQAGAVDLSKLAGIMDWSRFKHYCLL